MLVIYAGLVLAGHLVVLLSPQLPSAPIAQALADLLLVLLAVAAKNRSWRRFCWPSSVFAAAFLYAAWHAHLALADRLQPGLAGHPVEVVGTVASLPRQHDRGLSFILHGARASDEARTRLPRRILVSWFRSARAPAPGETWRLRLRLREPRGLLNPGGFDREAWLFRERIGATASVVNADNNALLGRSDAFALLQWRGRIAARVSAALDGRPAAGLITGLAVGVRHHIAPDQWQTLARTGTSHLVAISGLHVGLVAGLIHVLVRICWGLSPVLTRRLSALDAAWPPALLAAITYALLSGFALPTRRALFMLALWYGARALRRPVRPASLLALALIASIAMDPLSVLSPGLWLSFVAVATLLLAGRVTVAGRKVSLARTQAHLLVGLAPLTMAVFGQLPLSALPANLLMIPLFSFLVIPLVLVSLVLMLVWPPLAAPLLMAPAWLISQIWPWLEALGSAGVAQWRGPGGGRPVWALLGMLAALWLGPRWVGRGPLCAALLLSALLARPATPATGSFSATLFDLGHGFALLVRTQGHSLLYDTGPSHTVESTLVPALQYLGIGGPDLIIASHDDASHVGGLQDLARRYPQAAVLTGAPSAVARGLGMHRATSCQTGYGWQWDGVDFEILQPGKEILWEDNDSSCVLRVSSAGMSLLVTGDLTARGEHMLIQRQPSLRADVIVGLNHGSNTASSPQLLATTGARWAVLPAAPAGRWNLPHPAVLERWRQSAAAVTYTGLAGAVHIEAVPGSGGLRVTGMREASRRLWHVPRLR